MRNFDINVTYDRFVEKGELFNTFTKHIEKLYLHLLPSTKNHLEINRKHKYQKKVFEDLKENIFEWYAFIF